MRASQFFSADDVTSGFDTTDIIACLPFGKIRRMRVSKSVCLRSLSATDSSDSHASIANRFNLYASDIQQCLSDNVASRQSSSLTVPSFDLGDAFLEADVSEMQDTDAHFMSCQPSTDKAC